MKIAVEGCAHGELEKIYDTILLIEKQKNIKIDLLICCGDFQSTRNENDLACMACPPKYRDMCSFYKYYSGEKKAPVLTLFIGGNHEASSYLQELAYGGWVAPNIFYLGYAGVVNIGGLRIGGISGIQKGHDYLKGHFEKSPYSENTKRSCYHIRNLEVFRLKQLSGQIDIMCSHDWPQGVYHYGNTQKLIKTKPYFQQEIAENKLGSSVCEELLNHLQPSYWFSAHLHVKFSAVIPHENGSKTKFLALDKCLPKRNFLQVLDIKHNEEETLDLKYDPEWLAILFLTNHLLSIKSSYNYMPGPNTNNERYNFTPTEEELDLIKKKFDNNFTISKEFKQSVEPYNPNNPIKDKNKQSKSQINYFTEEFCNMLSISDPLALLIEQDVQRTPKSDSFNDSLCNDSYSSFQSTPSGLSTPFSVNKSKSLMNSSGSILKKLNLPSPKESFLDSIQENDSLLSQQNDSCSDVSSIILDDSLQNNTPDSVALDSSVEIIESVDSDDVIYKKFKPYKPSFNSISNVLPLPKSPLASTLPKPKFDHIDFTPSEEKANTDLNSKEPVTPVHSAIKKFKRRNESMYKNEDDG